MIEQSRLTRDEVLLGLTEVQDPEFLFAKTYLADAGIDLRTNIKGSHEFLLREAIAGSAEAQMVLAKLLLTGLLESTDVSLAYQWCTRAAEAGYAPAIALLSTFYDRGIGGIARDEARALALLKSASVAGYPHATLQLSEAFRSGIGVEENQQFAKELLVKAAETSYPAAQFLYGVTLLESSDEKEKREGLRLVKAAADQDNLHAHRELAWRYRIGDVLVNADSERAEFHRRRVEELLRL